MAWASDDDEELMRLVEQEVVDFEQLASTLQQHSSVSHDLVHGFASNPMAHSDWISDECLELQQLVLEEKEVSGKMQSFVHTHPPETACVQPQLMPFLLSVYEKLEQLQSQVQVLQRNASNRLHVSSSVVCSSSISHGPEEEEKVECQDDSDSTARQVSQWQRRVYQELQTRQHAQRLNEQLRQLVRRQQQVSQQMSQLLLSRVQQDRTLWRIYETMHSITNARRRLFTGSSPTTASRKCGAGTLTPPWLAPLPQLRFKWLVQRLEFSLQQMDLVFQSHQRILHPMQLLQAQAQGAHHQLKIRCVKTNGNGNEFVELVGSTVTCFDADTLLKLFWKLFAWKSRAQESQAEVSSFAANTCTGRPRGRGFSKKRRRRHVSGENLVAQFEKRMVGGDAVQWRADFDTMLSQLHVSVQVNAVLKRLSNGFLLEGIGQMQLQEIEKDDLDDLCGSARGKTRPRFEGAKSSRAHAIAACWKTFPKIIDISRSVWFRVEPLADGRSAIHHVHRVMPLDIPKTEAEADASPHEHHTRQQREQQQALKMELLTELLQHAHSEMSSHFQRVLLEHFLTQTPAFERGWPREGTMF